jgi:flagellar motor switch protein FliN/FliY
MADPSPTPPNPPGDKPAKGAVKPQAPPAAQMAEQALKAAEQAVSSLQQNVAPGAAPANAGAPTKFEPQAFDKTAKDEPPRGIDLLSDVNLNVKIELGRTRMLVEDVLKLGEGAVVELDKLAGDPVDVYVNERHIARGEVLVLNDNFCVRINEIVQDGGELEPIKKK